MDRGKNAELVFQRLRARAQPLAVSPSLFYFSGYQWTKMVVDGSMQCKRAILTGPESWLSYEKCRERSVVHVCSGLDRTAHWYALVQDTWLKCQISVPLGLTTVDTGSMEL